STLSGKRQPFQEKCQRFQENVNLFRKKTVNHIRKKSKNCQPKSGKDIIQLSRDKNVTNVTNCDNKKYLFCHTQAVGSQYNDSSVTIVTKKSRKTLF
ncbi:MAG: hypothetical protein IJT97_10595, partial [Bacteroidaceae bacterium]|nr:hypothetical protein [Bacteroidaceae bacterium]